MSFYPQFEETANCFLPQYSSNSRKSVYNSTPDFTIKIFPIRSNPDDVVILGDEVADHKANIRGTNADRVVRGTKIHTSVGDFIVENEPRPNKLFNRYKLILRRT